MPYQFSLTEVCIVEITSPLLGQHKKWLKVHLQRFLPEPIRLVAHQIPLCMGFSRQEYWSALPYPPQGDLPDLGIELPLLSRHKEWLKFHLQRFLPELYHNLFLGKKSVEFNGPKCRGYTDCKKYDFHAGEKFAELKNKQKNFTTGKQMKGRAESTKALLWF